MPLRHSRLLGALPTLAGALALVFAAGCVSKRVTRIEPRLFKPTFSNIKSASSAFVSVVFIYALFS